LSNPVWAELNSALAAKLLPAMMVVSESSPVAPEPVAGTKTEEKPWKTGRRLSPSRAAVVEAELRRDPARTDKLIALETRTSRNYVRDRREKMEDAGAIPFVPIEERARRPRPLRYTRRKLGYGRACRVD
jgi:hypothetical protein